MAFHRNQTAAEGVHSSLRWTYASAAARATHTPTDGPSDPLAAVDIGGFAQDLDTESVFVLTSVTPVTWQQLGVAVMPAGLVIREAQSFDTTTRFTTGTAGVVVDTVTFTPTVTGQHELDVSYIWSCDSTQSDFIGRILEDPTGSPVNLFEALNSDLTDPHRQEQQDSGGGGPAGTDQRQGGVRYRLPVQCTAGVAVTYGIWIAPQTDGVEAAVYHTAMLIERVTT